MSLDFTLQPGDVFHFAPFEHQTVRLTNHSNQQAEYTYTQGGDAHVFTLDAGAQVTFDVVQIPAAITNSGNVAFSMVGW